MLSRRWITSGLKLAVLMIDGIHFEEHVMLAPLGIDESDLKHVLGPWEGATENTSACKGLLEDVEIVVKRTWRPWTRLWLRR